MAARFEPSPRAHRHRGNPAIRTCVPAAKFSIDRGTGDIDIKLVPCQQGAVFDDNALAGRSSRALPALLSGQRLRNY